MHFRTSFGAALSLALTASSAIAKTVISYSTVTGYFLQDDPATNTTGFDYVGL